MTPCCAPLQKIGNDMQLPCAAQYYFETIFPRIPKPVADDLISKLTSMGLPTKAQRNGGQGGPDRRGVEEPNRRPASVKASLCAAHLSPRLDLRGSLQWLDVFQASISRV